MRRRYQEILLVIAYVLLCIVVVSGAFFVHREFDDAHHDQCDLAQAQAALVAIDISLTATRPPDAKLVEMFNNAVRQLNATCGTDIQEFHR